jgi:hypothetical protein
MIRNKAALVKRLQKELERLGKDRDSLRSIQDEIDEGIYVSTRALEALECAIEALSEIV